MLKRSRQKHPADNNKYTHKHTPQDAAVWGGKPCYLGNHTVGKIRRLPQCFLQCVIRAHTNIAIHLPLTHTFRLFCVTESCESEEPRRHLHRPGPTVEQEGRKQHTHTVYTHTCSMA